MRRLITAALVVSLLAPAGYFLAAGSARGHEAAAAAAHPLLSACADTQEHALPVPTTVPPAQFVDFEKAILAFLQSGEYKRLGWCRDKGSTRMPLRDTGPFVQGVYYGTHPAVRIYYSPRAMQWLLAGRVGPLPDGAMIIKEQYRPPRTRYVGLNDDTLPRVADWTIMIKDSKGAKDGWFWGEFFDEMRFDDDAPPFQYPWAGFGLYCLRCHGAAEKEYTFASLDNVRGFPGWPTGFFDDGSWRMAPGDDAAHANPVPPTPLVPARSARATGPQSLDAEVAITNLAGHRFPSGVGFRRAFLELLVFEEHADARRLAWASGRTNSLGVIVDGDGHVLPSEFFTYYIDAQGQLRQHFQPHYQVITSPDQVQIYEELNTNAEGRFTTSFIRRDQTIKDNRLLPIGWTAHGPDPSLNGRFLASTHAEHVHGDPDYEDGLGKDAATQRLYYLASHLKLEGTPAESWKLKIGSARTAITPAEGPAMAGSAAILP